MAGWLEQVPNKIKRLFSVSFTKNCPTDDIRYEDNHYRYTQSKKTKYVSYKYDSRGTVCRSA